jgi:IS1 family transposase
LQRRELARLPAPADDAIELDELCLRQTPALWMWLVVSRLTRQVLGFALGDHTDGLLEAAWSVVPDAYRDKPVCTDQWGAYARFFSEAQHTACDKGSGLTSIVEGLNTKWRQRQSGLVRRSCGVHINITDDIFERFLLMLDSHNQHCEQQWRKNLLITASTPSNP